MTTKKEEVEKNTEVPVRGGGGLGPLRDEVNRLFDRFAGLDWPWHRRRGLPANESPLERDLFAGFEWPSPWGGESAFGRADLSRTDDGYELQIDLPGLKKDDISVELTDGILTVTGERSDEREDERKGYYLSERSYGAVRRSFRVPDSVRTDDIRADFRDGVLTLTMPRTEEAQRAARRIEVE